MFSAVGSVAVSPSAVRECEIAVWKKKKRNLIPQTGQGVVEGEDIGCVTCSRALWRISFSLTDGCARHAKPTSSLLRAFKRRRRTVNTGGVFNLQGLTRGERDWRLPLNSPGLREDPEALAASPPLSLLQSATRSTLNEVQQFSLKQLFLNFSPSGPTWRKVFVVIRHSHTCGK